MEPRRFCWSSAALSDVGLVRRMNEDACLDACERGLWAVADGMGGHDFGELASSMVVEALDCQPPCTSLAALTLAVRNRLKRVNDDLRRVAISRGVPMMGTTAVVLLAAEADCAILWAGDSRAYLMRRGVLQQMTRDHRQPDLPVPSGAADAGTAISASGTSPASGPANARNLTGSGTNVITRAIGAAATLILEKTGLSAEDGDIFLLCSDGLTNLVTDAEIAQVLMHAACRQAAQALVALALQRGGTDNVTVVVISVIDLFSAERTVFNPEP